MLKVMGVFCPRTEDNFEILEFNCDSVSRSAVCTTISKQSNTLSKLVHQKKSVLVIEVCEIFIRIIVNELIRSGDFQNASR